MDFFNEFKSGKWIPYTVAVCSGVVLYLALTHIGIIGVAAASIWNLIAPLAIGVILAYIIDPAVVFFEKKGLKRKLALTVTLLIILAVVLLLCAALIPQLVGGVMQFLGSLSGYITTLEEQIMKVETAKTGGTSAISEAIKTVLDQVSTYLTGNSLLQDTSGFGSGFLSFVIGVIFAIYFLSGKEGLVRWVQQLLRKFLKDEKYEKLAQFCSRCNEILLRYIVCSLLEAFIVGMVNLVFQLIFRMPYASMISLIVGVTNLAPTFGPVVGCVLGVFILLLAKPSAIIWFVLFTLVLQTIDGYVIKPKLFGGTLGVSPLLILIVLVVGGRMFGVWGLLLAIPFAAIIQFSVQDYLFPFTENRFGKENRKQRKEGKQRWLNLLGK